MVDGTYAVEVKTPLGFKSGTISVATEGDQATVSIDAPVLGKKTLKGTASDDSFEVEGVWKLLMFGKVEYSVKGTVYGDDLALDIHTSKGSTKTVGVRI